jgi:DnaJ-class molecular chaperone
MEKSHVCADCSGTGIFRDKVSTCCFCEGTGQMDRKQYRSYRDWVAAMGEEARKELEKAKAGEPSKWFSQWEESDGV